MAIGDPTAQLMEDRARVDALEHHVGKTVGGKLPVYGPEVDIDANGGKYQPLVVTDNKDFTIKAPSANVPGRELILDIQNGTDKSLGKLIFDPIYKLAGSKLTAPKRGDRQVISFICDGANWIELSRTSNDLSDDVPGNTGAVAP